MSDHTDIMTSLARMSGSIDGLRESVDLRVQRLDRDLEREASAGREEHDELWAAVKENRKRTDWLEDQRNRAIGFAAGIAFVAGSSGAGVVLGIAKLFQDWP